MKSRDGLRKAQTEFAALLEEIRTKAGLSDEERIEATRKAIKLCPRAISEPVVQDVRMAAAILRQYGFSKERHSPRHRETGRFIPAAEAPAEEPGPFRFFRRHLGASLFR
jgi:hypothetical protein